MIWCVTSRAEHEMVWRSLHAQDTDGHQDASPDPSVLSGNSGGVIFNSSLRSDAQNLFLTTWRKTESIVWCDKSKFCLVTQAEFTVIKRVNKIIRLEHKLEIIPPWYVGSTEGGPFFADQNKLSITWHDVTCHNVTWRNVTTCVTNHFLT